MLKCQEEGLPLVDAVGVLVDPAEAEAPLEEHAERREVAGARALQRRDLDPHDINFLSNSSRIQLCTEKYKS